MNGMILKKIAIFSALLLTSVLLMQFVWHVSEPESEAAGLPNEKVNLALRRTAHQLLKEAGDSTSQIAPVERTSALVWQIRLEQAFDYDRLPNILRESFGVHGISLDYDVAVLRCFDRELMLGYNFTDFMQQSDAPCAGRLLPPDCYLLSVDFASGASQQGSLPLAGWFFSGALAVVLYGLWLKRRPVLPGETTSAPAADTAWLHFGQSRLDVGNLRLVCGNNNQSLTYREAKLLHLFARHPNQVLERGFILENVWADEGILVGRSVDMFVSRLRKMLRNDPSVQFVAVHGVGYRMEVAA
jgi:hypothetical protein